MYPIQIRAHSAYGPEVDFAAAVKLAMGLDGRVCALAVTAVYAEDTPRRRKYGDDRDVHKAGSPVFGLEAELRCRATARPQDRDAQVSIGGIASHPPEIAMVRAQCYLFAAQIAAAANAAAAATAS